MSIENQNNPDAFFNSQINGEKTRIKVIGVGGAGGNAVDRLKLDSFHDALSLAVVNSDLQALNASPLTEKVFIGRNVTRGLSAGGDAELGRKTAEADVEALKLMVEGQDIVIILSGLGGGIGSGVSPLLAELAADADALVIAFVTMPFTFEGRRRHTQAEESVVALRERCHAVIPLPNDIIMQQLDEDASVLDAFAKGDEWINRGVCALSSMLFQTGLINVDFGVLRGAFFARGGKTLYGLGFGEGSDCVNTALKELMLCPLLHTPEFSNRADSLIVHIEGGPGLTMKKVNKIMTVVTEKFDSKENTVLGAHIDESMNDQVRIFVLGNTDVDGHKHRKKVRVPHKTTSLLADEEGEGVLDVSAKGQDSVHVSRLNQEQLGIDLELQNEFDFNVIDEDRGFFKTTESNIYDGEDLDVPTYLRRGIKIQLV